MHFADAGLSELDADGEVELVPSAHGLVHAVVGEVDRGVVEELAGGYRPVAIRRVHSGCRGRAGTRTRGAECTALPVSEVPQVVDVPDRLGELGAGLGRESEDEVALDADAALDESGHD